MDRALKERIIGAIVLVVFVVLVVPIFLDGPPAESETVSAPVRLPGQDAQEAKTVVLDRERDVPIPAARNEAPTNNEPPPATQPVETPSEAVEQAPAQAEAITGNDEPQTPAANTQPEPLPEEPAATQPAATDAASTTGMWAVQLGSFRSKENAEGLASSLRKEGYAAFLSQRSTADGPMHRVRIGPQANRDAAEKTAARLAAEGHAGQVVPHP